MADITDATCENIVELLDICEQIRPFVINGKGAIMKIVDIGDDDNTDDIEEPGAKTCAVNLVLAVARACGSDRLANCDSKDILRVHCFMIADDILFVAAAATNKEGHNPRMRRLLLEACGLTAPTQGPIPATEVQ